jgi:Family of unknown function (DUF6463)
MLRLSGWWWIAVSAIHALGGIILYFEQWQAIAQAGWFNVIAPDPFAPIFDREDAFWFMFLTPFLFLIGELSLWAVRKKLVFPVSVGNFVKHSASWTFPYACIWYLVGITT